MSVETLVIPLAAIGVSVPIVIVPTVLIFRHVSRKREFDHLERMKALETGQSVPGDSKWPAAFVCGLIGAGVPLGSFLLTTLAMEMNDLPPSVWLAPIIVSVVALRAVASLGGRVFRTAPVPTQVLHSNGKPAFDPESLDFAGRGV